MHALQSLLTVSAAPLHLIDLVTPFSTAVYVALPLHSSIHPRDAPRVRACPYYPIAYVLTAASIARLRPGLLTDALPPYRAAGRGARASGHAQLPAPDELPGTVQAR
jgi:hypothetical protein